MTSLYQHLKPILDHLEKTGTIEDHGFRIERTSNVGPHTATLYTPFKVVEISAQCAKHLNRAIAYEFFTTQPLFQRMLSTSKEFEEIRCKDHHTTNTTYIWS